MTVLLNQRFLIRVLQNISQKFHQTYVLFSLTFKKVTVKKLIKDTFTCRSFLIHVLAFPSAICQLAMFNRL